jgi:hypothetical protein
MFICPATKKKCISSQQFLSHSASSINIAFILCEFVDHFFFILRGEVQNFDQRIEGFLFADYMMLHNTAGFVRLWDY